MNTDILQHMERHFGPVHEQALIEIVPSLNVAINLILPTPGQDSIILFTTGMGDHAQTVPEGQEAYRYTELFIRLPANWPMDDAALSDPNNFWPFEWLRRIAAYPHQNQTWLGGRYTIIANDEPPKPLAPNTRLSCLLLIQEPGDAGTIPCADGRQIVLYSIIPLYEEERDLEVKSGIRELLTRFYDRQIARHVDVARVNVSEQPVQSPMPVVPPIPPSLPGAAVPPSLPAVSATAASRPPAPPHSAAATPQGGRKNIVLWLILGGVACAGLVVILLVVFVAQTFRHAQVRQEQLLRDYDATPLPNNPNRQPPGNNPAAQPSAPPPAWVPIYPDLARPPHFFRHEENGMVKGRANFDTPDPMEKVKAFFEDKLKSEGFEIVANKAKARILESAEVDGKKADTKQSIHVTIHGTKVKTAVLETYEEPASTPPP
jgi:hypothetical protein